jgi:hypothetical protein
MTLRRNEHRRLPNNQTTPIRKQSLVPSDPRPLQLLVAAAVLLLVLVLDPLEPASRALLHFLQPHGRDRLGLLHAAALLLAGAVLPPARAGARVAAVVPLVRPRRAERVAPLHLREPWTDPNGDERRLASRFQETVCCFLEIVVTKPCGGRGWWLL